MEIIKLGNKTYELLTVTTRKLNRSTCKKKNKNWTKFQVEKYGLSKYTQLRNTARRKDSLYDFADIIEMCK